MENKHTSAETIADEELRECIGRIQGRIGVEHDGIASFYFSFAGYSKEAKSFEAAVQMLTDYIKAEREFVRDCNDSPDGQHEPDPSTFHLEGDGDGVYLDVNCKKCGRSGSIGRFKAEDVDW